MRVSKVELIFMADRFSSVGVLETIKSLKIVRRWAYVLHVRTELHRPMPHYHLFLELMYSAEMDTLAALFGVPSSAIHGIVSVKSYLKFLCVGCSPTDVIANFDYPAAIGRK